MTFGMPLLDSMQRPLADLRVSVTDRCNLRCTYCMPREVFGPDFPFLEREELLSYEEIARVAAVFARLGVTKIRLTGGEPLLRRELPRLIRGLSGLAGIEDLTLTTNGLLLAEQAEALQAAGLDRVTVSLDALDSETFGDINGMGVRVERVLEGIDRAAAVGLRPIKINCVVQRGINDGQLVDLASRFKGSGHILRFIEYMDVGNSNGWRLDQVVPSSRVVETIDRVFPLEPTTRNYPGEVAGRWRYKDGSGEIGVISSVTQPFCGACTRIRLSSDGRLFTCLFASGGFDLRSLLRGGAGDSELEEAIRGVWSVRNDRYSEIRSAATRDWPKVEMSRIGG